MAHDDNIFKYLSSIFPPQVLSHPFVDLRYPNIADPSLASNSFQLSPLVASLLQHPLAFSIFLPQLSAYYGNPGVNTVTYADAATQTVPEDALTVCSPKQVVVGEDVEEHFKRSLGNRYPTPSSRISTVSADEKRCEANIEISEPSIKVATGIPSESNRAVSPANSKIWHEEDNIPEKRKRPIDSTSKDDPSNSSLCNEVCDVDDHFRKALGSKWPRLSSGKFNS